MTIRYGEQGYGNGSYPGVIMKEATATLVTEEKGKITITVEDDDGNAFQGVSLALSGDSSATGSTDDTGMFTFSDLGVGSYTVSIDDEDYKGASTSFTEADFTEV